MPSKESFLFPSFLLKTVSFFFSLRFRQLGDICCVNQVLMLLGFDYLSNF